MLKWGDVLSLADQGNLTPDRRVTKTDAEWLTQLTNEEYRVTRQSGTERAFSSEMCSLFQPGLYVCVCCDTLLFDANEKFDSGTGWPSFTQPVKDSVIAYHSDDKLARRRIETTCNICDAHLGHVFPDGPQPSGLRYCMNAVALKKVPAELETATFGGGCFWCTEALFQQLRGVKTVASGYSGGKIKNPCYREVCSGTTGHAEVIQVTFDPFEISYEDLLRVHFGTHDPATLNQQGADKGTQYRSVIFPHNEQQQASAEKIITAVKADFNTPVVTTIEPFKAFYKAEERHQNYYQENSDARYCQLVIDPKLEKLKAGYSDKLNLPRD